MMIFDNPFPSYAQYNEDIIIAALLFDVEKGFYVDVGANHPVNDSVTRLFYDRGWRGINIEPIPSIFKKLQRNRTADINLNIGVSDKASEITFYENKTMPGHSSFDENLAYSSYDDKVEKVKIKTNTLYRIFKSNKVGKISFLKIDVEGYETPVIKGNKWKKYRPEVICIESNGGDAPWKKVLTNHNYTQFINDGLNDYYIAEESWHRTEGFSERVAILHHKAMNKHQYDDWVQKRLQLKKVTKLNKIHHDMMEKLKSENVSQQ